MTQQDRERNDTMGIVSYRSLGVKIGQAPVPSLEGVGPFDEEGSRKPIMSIFKQASAQAPCLKVPAARKTVSWTAISWAAFQASGLSPRTTAARSVNSPT